MKISPINNNQNISHKAVNQKYYEWAKREMQGVKALSEIFFQLEFDVYLKKIQPQDALDTLNAIKQLLPKPRKGIETSIKYIKNFLDEGK